MYLGQNKHSESLCCMYLVHTLGYRIVVGLRLFINQIFFENVDEKKKSKMTKMPRLKENEA